MSGWIALALLAPLLVAIACGHAADRSPVLERASKVLAQPIAPSGAGLALQCEPSDAEVSVDGVLQGRCDDFGGRPRVLGMGVGDHTLEFRKPGYRPERLVSSHDGARATLHIRLQRINSGESS
ncbi:MAG: hypothetical protein ACKVPX_01835 [Myxococcaceae bacterium]